PCPYYRKNADGSGYPLYLLRFCEDRKRMSLLSLTLYAVQKHLLLFPFWLPVVKLKRGFGFIVHDNTKIEFIARIAFSAFDKVGLSFAHKAIYIGNGVVFDFLQCHFPFGGHGYIGNLFILYSLVNLQSTRR